MKNPKTLCSLQAGQCGCIRSVGLCGPLRQRLQDLGMIEGTPVICLQKGPCGDPIAYRVRSTTVAIRKKDASCIHIR